MNQFLVYLFWPNPGNASYESPKAIALLVACALLIAAAVAIKLWRQRTQNGVLRKLSKSWGVSCFWFGLTGLILVIARVEMIQFLAMRILWVVWGVLAALVLVLQVRVYRLRYYQVLPTPRASDPREKYLPGKKK